MKRCFFAASVWPSIAIFWILLLELELDLVYCAALSLAYVIFYFLLAFKSEETSKLDYAVLFYFGAGLALTLLDESLGRIVLDEKSSFFLFMSLFVAAAGPLMLGSEPFTMVNARKSTPKAYWTTELFVNINVIMTRVWAGLFMAGALVSLVPGGGIWIEVIIPMSLILVVGLPFNAKFPDWYQMRAGKTGASTPSSALTSVESTTDESNKDLPAQGEYAGWLARDVLADMASTYNRELGGDFCAIVQFDISGDQTGQYYLDFKDGSCDFSEGVSDDDADVIIHTPWEVWQAIQEGEMSGQEAMMQGKYSVEGDLSLFIRMGQIFDG